jgi:hypothetical protein
MLFTRVAPRTKRQGFLIGGPLLSKKLILFTHVAPRIKSKGLAINAPHIFYYFQQALRRVQNARGLSINTPHISSITFSTHFAAYKKEGAP